MSGNDIEIECPAATTTRCARSLPGMACNASGRPYIRGSLADDMLVRYDGITLIDPFHLKNFQSLISAIDPAGVERIEVFSGGFPVHYGTRSGGVIDVTAPDRHPGYEYRASVQPDFRRRVEHRQVRTVAGGVAVRDSPQHHRSLDPVENYFGKPQFSDSLGRLRWDTENGAWTLGWLLLDDRIELGNTDDEETANATYRDEYLWLARDHAFNSQLSTRATLVLSSLIATGSACSISLASPPALSMPRSNSIGLEASPTSGSMSRKPASTYTFGVEVGYFQCGLRLLARRQLRPQSPRASMTHVERWNT